MKFTNDPYVKETLNFLMTREIAHFQMFEAALETIKPNFPPGVLQGDPAYSNAYFNMSNGTKVRGPWNEGKSTKLQEEWQYIEDPDKYVKDTDGLVAREVTGTTRTRESVDHDNKTLSQKRSEEIKNTVPSGANQWSLYEEFI